MNRRKGVIMYRLELRGADGRYARWGGARTLAKALDKAVFLSWNMVHQRGLMCEVVIRNRRGREIWTEPARH